MKTTIRDQLVQDLQSAVSGITEAGGYNFNLGLSVLRNVPVVYSTPAIVIFDGISTFTAKHKILECTLPVVVEAHISYDAEKGKSAVRAELANALLGDIQEGVLSLWSPDKATVNIVSSEVSIESEVTDSVSAKLSIQVKFNMVRSDPYAEE